MPEPTHARFSQSKLPRIIRCPGSVMYDDVDQGTSTFADEGTYLHSLMNTKSPRTLVFIQTEQSTRTIKTPLTRA
jgi:hypothetical protein